MTITDILLQYYSQVLPSLVDLIIKIVGALFVVIVGWILAWLGDYAVRWFITTLKINDFLKRLGLHNYFEKADIAFEVEKAAGFVVFWLIFGLFLMAAFDVLGLSSVNFFIKQAINYLPKALVGALILIVAVFVGEFVKKLIIVSLKGSGVKSVELVSGFAKWSIIVFGVLMALSQWGIAPDIINILVSGLVAFLVLAGGLAFGLGGQDVAREILENLRKDLRKL
jgi:hypothetical protein